MMGNTVRKNIWAGKPVRVLAAVLLSGLAMLSMSACGTEQSAETMAPEVTAAATEPAPTVPADGSAADATCKGSYTDPEVRGELAVAAAGDSRLTNDALQVYYRMELAAYEAPEGQENQPDFSRPLDTQPCPVEGYNSWQQYFLQQAVETWYRRTLLEQKSFLHRVREEKNFEYNTYLHENYMDDCMAVSPAQYLLYDDDATFEPNDLHREFLENIPQMLEDLAQDQGYAGAEEMARGEFGSGIEGLTEYTRLLNWDYAYFTELSYDIPVTDEETAAYLEEHPEENRQGTLADFRQILVKPDPGESREDLMKRAQSLINHEWNWKKATEAAFAALANKRSDDEGTALDGGLFSGIRPGQTPEAMDAWLFDSERKTGDTVLLESDQGVHILYFIGTRDISSETARRELTRQKLLERAGTDPEDLPLRVFYRKVGLTPVEALPRISAETDLLYRDVAHERFPRVPIYIQQDYVKAPYGAYTVSSHGCGIASLAMLSTYMTDTRLTPAMLAERYGSYNGLHGTDISIMEKTPPEMGYYLDHRSYDWEECKAALREGKLVVTLQVKGYFTRAGHYLVLDGYNEDGLLVVRDSNVFNYFRLPEHQEDAFPDSKIPPNSAFTWIFQKKITRIPICARCGDAPSEILSEDYICPRCEAALLRRETFLETFN